MAADIEGRGLREKRSQKIHLFDFEDKQVWVTVTVWPTLKAMREGNQMKPWARCYAHIQPWYLADAGGLRGEIHFAEKYVHHELAAHECDHFKRLLYEELQLDLYDPDDEETCAILGGQLNAAVIEAAFPHLTVCHSCFTVLGSG